MSDLRLDGVLLTEYLSSVAKAATASPAPPNQTFWSTAERPQSDTTVEVLEINLNGERLVNSLQFDAARFPHIVTAEWYDPSARAWEPFRGGQPEIFPTRELRKASGGTLTPSEQGVPVQHAIHDSMPQRVGTPQPNGQSAGTLLSQHPQHHGADHWVSVAWRTAPVSTSRVRLLLVRGPGVPPARTVGGPSPYSLGVRSLQIGYRVTTKSDVPPAAQITGDSFGSSIDLLGSRVTFSMRESKAAGVLSPTEGVAWRSEPQPVNYAVVNFYLDTRTGPQDPLTAQTIPDGGDLTDAIPSGQGQVVDRFYIDPLTVGAHVNLYFSNDEPTEVSFAALDEPLNFPVSQETGAVTTSWLDPSTDIAAVIEYSSTDPVFTDVDNTYLQFSPAKAWWLGMDLLSRTGNDGVAGGVADHPWISFGGNTLRQNGPTIEFVTATGKVCSLDIDVDHMLNAPFQVCVAFNPDGPPAGLDSPEYPKGLTLIYRFADRAPVEVTRAVQPDDFGSVTPPVFSIGRYNDVTVPGIPALGMRSMVLKIERPVQRDEILDYLEYPDGFAVRPISSTLDLGMTNNALLRAHPGYVVAALNPAGLVGGPGDRYSEMVWTPIFRDYVLRRGFMNLPPTRAKYWKFEFTQLVAEHYETFVPITRTVKLFPATVVDEHTALNAGSHWSPKNTGTPGIQTALDLADANRYSNAIGLLRESTAVDTTKSHTATEALYVRDPAKAAELAKRGWIWSYQPWSIGSTAPKFNHTQQHTYETVTVVHTTKVGFFAGLKSLQAYRLDYGVEDDTEQYVEHFHDRLNIASSDQVDWTKPNRITTYSSGAEVVSKTFHSRRPVHGLQFATIQSDANPLLPDDGFHDPVLADHWTNYGDASITRLSDRTVLVNRGWTPRTYASIETDPAFTIYSGLEGRLYAELEGSQPNGLAGGGLSSEPVTPSGSGRVYAAVQVATSAALNGPVRLEIVSTIGDVVLAAADKAVTVGQEEVFYVGYRVGAALNRLTYGHYEGSREVTDDALLLDAGMDLPHLDDGGTVVVYSTADGSVVPTTDYALTTTSTTTTLTRDPSATLPDRSPVQVVHTSVWTYGDLDGVKYGQLETQSISGDVYARVIQEGRFSDAFLVKKLSIFDSALAWEFSNDGVTWWDGTEIRNNPDGVLTFPTVGNQLRWRLHAFHADASVSALSFRPWYGGV